MKILYLKPSNSPFVIIDQEILENNYDILLFELKNQEKKILFTITLIKFFIFCVIHRKDISVIYTRFADYHAALAVLFSKIFKKKSVIVIGGYDVNNIPKYKYGAHYKKLRGLITRYALNHASLLIPNSYSLVQSTNLFVSTKPVKVGIKHFAPNTKAQIKVIPNGYHLFSTDNLNSEKDNSILTVAVVENLRTYYIKGIDIFLKCAEFMPNRRFIAVGIKKEFLFDNSINVPKNVEIVPKLPQKDLINYYKKAKVFCLLSRTEGMPNVLCEAMLYKCIPVATNVGAISEIINDLGFVINSYDINKIVGFIEIALKSDGAAGVKAMNKIKFNYSYKIREQKIKDVLSFLLTNKFL